MQSFETIARILEKTEAVAAIAPNENHDENRRDRCRHFRTFHGVCPGAAGPGSRAGDGNHWSWKRRSALGGKIWSRREEGFLCEWGPNGFLDNKPMTLELCQQLGIRDRLLRSNDNARKRFIYSGGELHRLPENGPAFLKSKLISWPGKARLACEPLVPANGDGEDETLADFARRRLGQEALDKLIGPMVSGIFAGDPETMSLQSCFPRIHELEQEYGGLIKAMVRLAKRRRRSARPAKWWPAPPAPVGC